MAESRGPSNRLAYRIIGARQVADNPAEFARTYKMNTHLRHNNPFRQAKVTKIRQSSEWVYLGDATSVGNP